MLQKTPAGFDASVCEFFLPLSGATRAVARAGGHKDPAYPGAHGARTGHHRAPVRHRSMLQAFLADPDAALRVRGILRRASSGGEALPRETAERFHERFPGVPLSNLYGSPRPPSNRPPLLRARR
ncbi:Carrier domain-containing protein OS=Streptomyces antimycoticus OX=68175 GN=SANT12839_040080 PE=4 SV=1 [Streptomyces antimycoticus]